MRLASALHAQFLVASLRLVLAVAGLGAAFALGAPRTPAFAAFALGLFGFVVSVSSAQRVVMTASPAPAPAHIRAPALVTLAAAAWPSTIGVAVLLVIALAVNATLAALMAGVEAGMGAAALFSASRILARERQLGGQLLVDGAGRVYLQAR